MTTTKKSLDEDPIVAKARRHWTSFRKEHPDVGHPAAHGAVVDDDTIVLSSEPGPGSIVAVYRDLGGGKLKLLAW